MTSTNFENLLLSCLKQRGFALLKNVFLARIFLDPRYKILLSEKEKKSSKNPSSGTLEDFAKA